jgi:uncharacterized protein YndB with AHSA1/START domain
MTTTTAIPPVRKRIRVNTAPARAFDIFTAGMRCWWRPDYSINQSPIQDIVMEPRAGGRWFERGEDGSECQWGKVLAWEPPGRLLLAWQITAEWRFDPKLVSELEVRFIPEGAGTLVELEHRLEGYGAAAAQVREIFDGPEAWLSLLARFAKEAEQR